MHAVLARETDDPAFAPERADADIATQWAEQAEQQLAAAFAALDVAREWEAEAAQDLAIVTAERDRLGATIRALAETGVRHDAHAHSRRSASRAGAGGERRCLHHRLRGRTGEAAGTAPDKESPAARRRRHAPLVRLRGRGDEAQECRHPGACRRPAARCVPADLRGGRGAVLPCRLCRSVAGRGCRGGTESVAALPDREGGVRDRL